MGSTPTPAGGNGAPPNISDVVSQDDLTRWAQLAGVLQYFTEDTPQPAPPAESIALAQASGVNTFSNLYAQMRSIGAPSIVAYLWAAFWASVISVLGILVGWAVRFLAAVLTPAATAVLTGLDELRKGIDPAVGVLAQSVLAEFLGTDVNTTQLPLGMGTGDHLTRASAIGRILVNQLETEFAQPTGGAIAPTATPASTFAGLAINFGLASGILGLVGGMVPYGHWEELREMGEEVAKNIGLGRLVRRAIQPYIQILVQQPLTWYLNQKYLPTQFPEAMLVNPYTAATLPHDQLFNAMNLLGYSNDKIESFIKMHQKRLSVHDLYMLVRGGGWTDQQAVAYVTTMGYPEELSQAVYGIEDLLEQQKWYDKLVSEMETEVKAGKLSIDEFTTILNSLPYSQTVRDVILVTVGYKVKAAVAAKPHHLSEGELHTAFEAGLLTDTDLQARWTQQGLSDADQQVRLLLLLLRLKRLTAEEVKQNTAYQQKQAAYSAKLLGQTAPAPPPIKPVPPFPLGS